MKYSTSFFLKNEMQNQKEKSAHVPNSLEQQCPELPERHAPAPTPAHPTLGSLATGQNWHNLSRKAIW